MEQIIGTVGIPNAYFLKMAKHDYRSYREALPREFFQNSIDAGATRIDVSLGEKSITVKDDGCGMSLPVLRDKLLVLGGSFKESEDAVGAFGKAKELLFFSWDSYEIITGGHHVIGEGAGYEINPMPNRVNGTTCIIRLDDAAAAMSHFNRVAAMMQTRCKIYVDGQLATCNYKRGKAVKEIPEIGTLHQVKCRQSVYMRVRINGVWMFSKYVGEGLGELVLELSGKSTNVLTSNRDGLKWEYDNKVSNLLNDLVVNKGSALLHKKPRSKYTIQGAGKVVVGEDILAAAKKAFEMNGSLRDIIASLPSADEQTAVMAARINAASTITEGEWDDFVEQIKFIGYRPDFVLLLEGGQDKTKFMATKKAKLLANMWTELIKQVLIDNRRYLEFTAGFCFNNNVEAEISVDGSDTVVYLNPNLLKTSTHRKVLMEQMKDLVIHELAHLRNKNHDSDFVNEMAELRKNTVHTSNDPYYAIQRTRAAAA